MGFVCTRVLSGCLSVLTANFMKDEKSTLLPHSHGVD